MNKIHLLHVTLIAILFSACSSLASVKETGQSNTNQSSQNNNRVIKNPGEETLEEKSDKKSDNAFAGLDSAQSENEKSKTVSQQRNAVCPIPGEPCRHKDKEFADWELSFKLPAKILPNKTYSSAPFYAIILKTQKSVEDCDGGEYIEALEAERKEFQSSQPDRKVFASYGCPNMDAVNYDFEGRMDATGDYVLIDNFIAVYAGETAEEAEVLRRSVRDEYPKAVVKKMTVNWERIVQ